MKQVFGTLLGVVLVALAGGLAFIYSGSYDVAATKPHWPGIYRVMDIARIRSIRVHAANTSPPADLAAPARLAVGAEHFASHCALCHSAPGVKAEDLARGMYPPPPALTAIRQQYKPSQLFWILKHGIKMSGMPSWADHTDAELWDMVAFMQALPEMSPEAYKALVKQAKAKGGDNMPSMNMPATAPGG